MFTNFRNELEKISATDARNLQRLTENYKPISQAGIFLASTRELLNGSPITQHSQNGPTNERPCALCGLRIQSQSDYVTSENARFVQLSYPAGYRGAPGCKVIRFNHFQGDEPLASSALEGRIYPKH
jgi:hypothetical protein